MTVKGKPKNATFLTVETGFVTTPSQEVLYYIDALEPNTITKRIPEALEPVKQVQVY